MPAIRVLVIDDSVVIRKVLCEALATDPAIEVAGSASDGTIGLAKIAILKPDLVTLDVEMPGMSGLETLVEIRKRHPKLPVIMFSTLTERGASITLDALALGASDYVAKPSNTGSLEETRARIERDLIPKVKGLCPGKRERNPIPSVRRIISIQARIDVVAIGTSTGGPNALAEVLPKLPRDFPVPIVVVVSYADFITLLFAFFVVLYSSAQVDKRKVGRLAMAIQVAFQELGVFDTSNTHIPLSDADPVPFSKVQVIENVDRSADMQRFVQPMKGILAPSGPTPPLKDVQAELEKALAPEIQKKVVDIKARKEGLIISLREMGFYESGSSTMRTSSLPAIDRLAAVLAPRAENIRVEGHTDNVPIHNDHFPSNWELSTARATELVKLFIYRYHVDPMRLSASGLAEFHPAADNDSNEGRARNRRVDVVILNPVISGISPFTSPGPVGAAAATPYSHAPGHSPDSQPQGP